MLPVWTFYMQAGKRAREKMNRGDYSFTSLPEYLYNGMCKGKSGEAGASLPAGRVSPDMQSSRAISAILPG